MKRLRSAAMAVVVLAVGAAAPMLHAADTAVGQRPILLELFTSEGCSSCPPVDVWAERLDAAQPVHGAEIIVLSEHVTYWDHDGWKDPFSSDQLTARQRGYEQMLGLGDPYTPQVILNGASEVRMTNSETQIRQTFEKAAAVPEVAVRLESLAIAPGNAGSLSGRVAVDATAEKHPGDVFVAVALERTQTDVLAGENDGKKLTNVAVVKDLVRVGKLEKGKSFEEPFAIRLWPGADAGNLRVVAFVQESGQGKVLGATMRKGIGSSAASATVATR